MRRTKIICICWHSVEPDTTNPEFLDGTNPTASLFREQIRFLITDYTPISIHQFMELAETPSVLARYKKPPVLISFDDGFKNVIDQALPILEEFGAPAAFFVIGEVLRNPEFVPWYVEATQLLRRTSPKRVTYKTQTVELSTHSGHKQLMHLFYEAFKACQNQIQRERALDDLAKLLGLQRPKASDLDSDLRFVTAEDLARLGPSSLLNVGSHAMSHRFLDRLSCQEQFDELQESHILLSKISPSYFPALAYPGSSFNASTVTIAKGLYKCAFALISGSSYRSLHMYPRILGETTASQLEYAISPLRLTYLLPFKRLLQAGRIRNGLSQ